MMQCVFHQRSEATPPELAYVGHRRMCIHHARAPTTSDVPQELEDKKQAGTTMALLASANPI
eukprot:scaffold4852_cov50-Attheya_sp.AAC.4